MSQKTGTRTFGWYSETCFYRSERFIYDQFQGMERATVRVLGCWPANRDEFPVASRFLTEEAGTPMGRVTRAILRRVYRHRPIPGHLPSYAVHRLVRHLSSRPVDLIYCVFGWNAAQLLEVLEQLDRRIPLVFLTAGSDVTSARSLGDDYLLRLLRAVDRASLVLCESEFLKRKLLDLGAPAEKIDTHAIGIRVPVSDRTGPGVDGPEFRALAVSRLSPVKNVPATIRSFARVVDSIPGATLEIIGDGEQRQECEAMIESLGLRDRVFLRGSRPLDEVYEAMRSAHVFLQHNVRTTEGQEEGLGHTIMEASAHRLPTIVTRSGGNAEIVLDGRSGVLVDPGDEAGMSRAILDLARDSKRRHAMGALGREVVMQRFDIRRQNRRLEDLLHRVCEEAWR